MKASTVLIGVGLGGAAIGLGVMLYRHMSPLGYYDPGRQKPPPLVKTTTAGGMTTKLYRNANMTIKQRIALIQGRIFEGINDPRMRQLALSITQNCPARDKKCEARAIYDAVRNRVRYTGDIAEVKHPDGRVEGIDLYQSPYRTWEFRGEDCDGHAILNGTLLSLNGITTKLRVTSPTRYPDWQHIYDIADVGNAWVAVDTTLPGSRFAVEAPYRRNVDFDA